MFYFLSDSNLAAGKSSDRVAKTLALSVRLKFNFSTIIDIFLTMEKIASYIIP